MIGINYRVEVMSLYYKNNNRRHNFILKDIKIINKSDYST